MELIIFFIAIFLIGFFAWAICRGGSAPKYYRDSKGRLHDASTGKYVKL